LQEFLCNFIVLGLTAEDLQSGRQCLYLVTPHACSLKARSGAQSSEIILAVRLDRHVGGRVRDARQAEAVIHLVVIQEGLI